VADKGAILTLAQRQNSITYFIGFHVDKYRMRGEQLNVEQCLQNFREWELQRFQPLIPGMDILVKVFGLKELPKICFEGMYEGGKTEAMKKRRSILEADPVRQEKKRVQRLNELKAKMAEIQRKKEEGKEKKRKREEVEAEEEVAQAVKQEELELAEADGESTKIKDEPGETEESNLLESALDTIQETGDETTKKTREEAEADRLKLLSGETMEEPEDEEGGNLSDEDEYGYNVDRGRYSILSRQGVGTNRDKRCMDVDEEDAEALRKLGYSVVTDDESKVLGADLIPTWREGSDEDEAENAGLPTKVDIKFRDKFDIVELDALGRVIDMGDEDFTPSKTWTGRKAGFEFKLGERGLGYYRTGKKVVVPSNTIY